MPVKKPEAITRTLYLPIEIFYRELGGALLLAACAVSRGWRVVLGGKQAIFNNMSRFRGMPGVFFLKSIVPGETFKQKEIAGFGHRIVSLDVEGLVPSNGEAGVRLRYSRESIALTDILFFWGRNHYQSVFNVYPQIKDKSVISGSPIIDEVLLRRKGVGRLRKGSGKPRILIGTSCGYANHINGKDFAMQMTRDAYSNNLSPREASDLDCEADLDERIFECWKHFIPRIARELRDCEIVLRPHPSENKRFWQSYMKGFDNVRINTSGSIIDQMLVSDAYIHFNSTSAITSMLLGIPTFMLLPELEKKMLERVTYVKDLSITAPSLEELITRIKSYISDPAKTASYKDISQYCENFTSPDFDASAVIMDSLERHFVFSLSQGVIGRRTFSEYIIVRLKKMKLFMFWCLGLCVPWGRHFPPRNYYKNAKAKQPNTSLESIREVLCSLLGKEVYGGICLKQLSKNLFLMEKADKHPYNRFQTRQDVAIKPGWFRHDEEETYVNSY